MKKTRVISNEERNNALQKSLILLGYSMDLATLNLIVDLNRLASSIGLDITLRDVTAVERDVNNVYVQPTPYDTETN